MTKMILSGISLPEGIEVESTERFTYISTGDSIPYQGWKIHVSATLANFQTILDKTIFHRFITR